MFKGVMFYVFSVYIFMVLMQQTIILASCRLVITPTLIFAYDFSNAHESLTPSKIQQTSC